MLGSLPEKLEVNGRFWEIDADYRNILTILEAFTDEELSDQEKVFICLSRLYNDFEQFEDADFQVAYLKACDFISYGSKDDSGKKKPRLIDWAHDEMLIFPAVNKAAGFEVRAVDFMHWWTFIGCFQSIDSDSLLGTVLSIRQKHAKGKKLEKWEKEFEQNNYDLCSLKPRKTVEEQMEDIFNDLLSEGEEG